MSLYEAQPGKLEPEYPNIENLDEVQKDRNLFKHDPEAPSIEEKDVFSVKAEKVELTPLEALKANVDGDQSPCKCSIFEYR